jgi:anti-sigma regulatory factor (Ser/Thr protein kinase)
VSTGALGFRHEALFYSGENGFLAATLPFIRSAVGAEQPIMVAVSEARINALRAVLNGEAEQVHFVDMGRLGRNPACIIPAWRDFAAEHAVDGRPLRGIGEPIWPGRSEAELVECQQHEALLNLAFAGVPAFWLVCPYDIGALDPRVLEEARRSHPFVAEPETSAQSDSYIAPDSRPGPFDGELPPPASEPSELAFGRDTLRTLRSFVSERAARAGLGRNRTADLVLAVSEVSTNSVLHGGGHGVLRMWQEGDTVLCEVRDAGRFDNPLVGRERPTGEQSSGRGLWLVNHLCDLVQLRSYPDENVVRLHMRRA